MTKREEVSLDSGCICVFLDFWFWCLKKCLASWLSRWASGFLHRTGKMCPSLLRKVRFKRRSRLDRALKEMLSMHQQTLYAGTPIKDSPHPVCRHLAAFLNQKRTVWILLDSGEASITQEVMEWNWIRLPITIFRLLRPSGSMWL